MQIPKGLVPMTPSTAEALQAERSKAQFSVAKMNEFIVDEEMRKQLIKVEKVLASEPSTFDVRQVYFMSRTEKMDHALKIGKRLIELMKAGRISADEISVADMILDINGPFGLHRAMFIPTLQNQATLEQQKLFLEPALNYEILGCYAQTEIGHGSNVQGLETTCTYIPETDEFEVHSPSISACKWWIGSLGVTATHAMVMAQLVVGGKRLGPNPVVVPIRSTEDHRPLPGVTVGDLGPKFGFNTMDNGFLLLDHVRVPRINLLQRYITVTREGKVSRPANVDPKVAYGTMVFVRTQIVRNMSQVLAKATTTAIRYAAMRRQFAGKADKPQEAGVESPVLDYGMVQYRLIPLLAQNYAMFATSQAFAAHYAECMAALDQGDFGPLKELHATACGLKRWTSDRAIHGIDTCRHACGGHGFSQFSGLNEFFGNQYPNIIWEGDNYVLSQQTARFLLTQVRMLRQGKRVADNQTTRYLRRHLPGGRLPEQPPACARMPVDQLAQDPDAQLDLLAFRAAAMCAQLADRMQGGQTWNRSLVDMQRLCDAHSDYIVAAYFRRHIRTLPASQEGSQALLEQLDRLSTLLFLYVLEQHPADLLCLPVGQFDSAKVARIGQLLAQLIEDVREQAVPLVDALGVSDMRLNSALARSDGKVYESYLEWAMEDPLNREDTGDQIRREWFNKYYKPVLHAASNKTQARL
ncbi:hypothetical protein IWW36_001673 [Coemansia brasiliensis]|uniref:Acyl-coenzyme A oxidase n=1 Tax=Coemansia brasiliensis TaxID=2650707 RepID=A0A9W8IDE8_9FUNG|nr:hypothetical protein IWW36_001673 [Coemansia brasiliensis]